MPRGVNNWTYNQIISFLKDNNFRLHHTRGSHFYYIGVVEKVVRQVCIPYHGKTSIKPRTMNGIIAQSGISKKDWLSNK